MATGSLENIYNWPASLNVTLGTYEYPNGSISFRHKTMVIEDAVWKDNTGSAHTYTLYLCDSTGNNRVALSPSLSIQASGQVTTADFTVSGGTALAGKALYIVPARDGTIVSDGFAFKTSSDVTIGTSTMSYSVTTAVNPAGSGTLAASKSPANPGDNIILTATPATGYQFSSWTTSPELTISNNAFTMPGQSVAITANFTKQSFTLTTAVSPSGYGTVTAGGSLEYGATKSLTATPGAGRSFSSWTKTAGTLSSTTANPTTFTMGTSAATVTANFTTNNYTLTVSKGTGISSATGGGSKAYGSANDITATASSGYTFNNWTSNNGGTFANANAASTKFTMPAGNVTVTANATINSYTLTVAKGTGGSSVTGGGTVNYNSSNNITATAAE